jgi:hypothetical protein
MPVVIQNEANNISLLQFSGILKRSEFGDSQTTISQGIDAGTRPRLLVILKDFQGWERGADWNDLDFMLSHGNEIAKIAIVGESRWEPTALAFAGAGFRRAPVKFLPSDQEAQARVWLED